MIHFFAERFVDDFLVDDFFDMRGAPAFGVLTVRLLEVDFLVEDFFLATMVGAQVQRRGQCISAS